MGTQSLKSLLTLVKKHRLHFCNCQRHEHTFSAQFLFAVDKRFQLWLGDCYRATTRLQVNDGWLNFSSHIEDVILGTFNVRLPPTFKLKDDAEHHDKASEKTSNDKDNKQKKQKVERNTLGKRVDNASQPEEFKMRAGETWQKDFKTKSLTGRPSWNREENQLMCARWYICGYCFDNCSNGKSHVEKDNIPADKFTAFTNYLKKCRNE